jgi:hypothetical protein
MLGKRQQNAMKEVSPPRSVSNATDTARPLPAIVRAHLVEAKEEQTSPQSEMMRRYGATDKEPYWPEVVLVFSTEAATDEFACLHFGTYIVEWLHPLTNEIERLRAGFFTGESLKVRERDLVDRYCKARELACLTRREWAEEVLFQYGYYSYGAVVGFNLPFSLSRVAVRASVIGLSRPQKPGRDGRVIFHCKTCHQRRKFRLEQEEDGNLSCFCMVCGDKARFRLGLLPDGRVEIVAGARKTFAGG